MQDTNSSNVKGEDSIKQDNAGSASTNSQVTQVQTSSPSKIQSILANKRRIIHRYFDELSQAYIQSHNRDLEISK